MSFFIKPKKAAFEFGSLSILYSLTFLKPISFISFIVKTFPELDIYSNLIIWFYSLEQDMIKKMNKKNFFIFKY